jgi:hypothetical protein
VEYGPLIAGGLLRVRLELCVVESFFQEAVGPFIAQNGVSWILPWHETVETFLAGAIFSLATTFILIGSTKIIMVVVTYTDILVGLPCRIFGGFAFDRASGKPVTLDLGFGPFKKRFIGPPEPKEGEAPLGNDISKADPLSLLVIILSGAVRVTGQAVGVLQSTTGVSGKLIVNNCYSKTALLFCVSLVDHSFLPCVIPFTPIANIPVHSLCEKYWKLLTRLLVAILFCWPPFTWPSSLCTLRSSLTFPKESSQFKFLTMMLPLPLDRVIALPVLKRRDSLMLNPLSIVCFNTHTFNTARSKIPFHDAIKIPQNQNNAPISGSK